MDKQSSDEFFDKLIDKNKKHIENKATRESVAQQFEDKAQKARSPVGRMKGMRYFSVGLGIGLLIMAGFSAQATAQASAERAAQIKVNEGRIADAKATLASLEVGDGQSVDEFMTELEHNREAARSLGEKVAATQNEFQQILYKNGAAPAGDGGSSPGERAAAEHRRDMAPLFTDDLFLVEGELAYSAGSRLPFDEDEIDPRFQWITSYVEGTDFATEGPKFVDPKKAEWSVKTVSPTDNKNMMSVMWLNTDPKTGEVFAYAIGDYLIDDNIFTTLELGYTTLGDARSGM